MDSAEDRLEHERRIERSPTENSSLRKYTNLDPCCYGNPLVEFHHQSNLAGGHAHTSTDWLTAALHLLRLVTCSLSAILLSSSRLISSSLRWGPFSCCLTISRSFLCCWERGGDRKQRNEQRACACAEELTCSGMKFSHKKRWGEREQKVQSTEQNKYPHVLIFCVYACTANLNRQFLTFGRKPFLF